jgi:hypothetical protein
MEGLTMQSFIIMLAQKAGEHMKRHLMGFGGV